MDIINVVKEAVNRIAPNNDVILFGSRARGDYKSESDWDFLIILQQEHLTNSLKQEIRESLYEIELQSDLVISTIIHTEKEWEKRSITPIYQVIKKEGVSA